MKNVRSPLDPRRGFQIADDTKPLAVEPPPPPPGSSEATAAALATAVSNDDRVEVRLRCLETLLHLQVRSNDARGYITAAAELEDYVLNGKRTEPATPPST